LADIAKYICSCFSFASYNDVIISHKKFLLASNMALKKSFLRLQTILLGNIFGDFSAIKCYRIFLDHNRLPFNLKESKQTPSY